MIWHQGKWGWGAWLPPYLQVNRRCEVGCYPDSFIRYQSSIIWDHLLVKRQYPHLLISPLIISPPSYQPFGQRPSGWVVRWYQQGFGRMQYEERSHPRGWGEQRTRQQSEVMATKDKATSRSEGNKGQGNKPQWGQQRTRQQATESTFSFWELMSRPSIASRVRATSSRRLSTAKCRGVLPWLVSW